jgi:putative ABC transport system substrate-binding protein
MRRREIITLLGSVTAAWSLSARAQQPMPVVGLLGPGSAESDAFRVTAFRQALQESGYIEGQNVTIEYRWAESQYDRLAVLATDLVRRRVAVIVAFSNASSLAAKAATTTIPIVFAAGADPVQLGLVASFNRPGGNATGITFFTIALEPKKLELLRELVPAATVIALLINPSGPNAESTLRDVQATANTIGQQIQIVNASDARDLDTAIATAVREGARALFVGADPLFTAERERLVMLTARYAIPAIYSFREFPVTGGLMSYGISFAEVYRQTGIYTAKILKGAKPVDLPVVRTTKFELVINLKTATALQLKVPDKLLALADEVIE